MTIMLDANEDDLLLLWRKFWFAFCFPALQHILGHFGRGQLP